MIKIQKVGLEDLKTLQEISRSTFHETFADSNTQQDMQHYLSVNFSLDQLGVELNEADSQFFMTWDKDRPVGYLKVNSGKAQSDLKEEDSLEIERIYVLNAYHGKKVGQLLYGHALEVARQLGKSSIWLGVWENNPRAIRFYEKNGFVIFGTHVFKMGEDEQTDLLMRKSLSGEEGLL
ncbi:MAG: GNAT family N-acetyltransferase [Pedobacter sp.]|uniref:GNAT family N-acetyltransferase n=1 Tax=Pedobacter sp. TaxID=1411316 RepID=UPI003569E6AB